MDTDDVLETGYGDGTPAGDNLVNDFTRGEAQAFGALARARGRDRIEDENEFQMLLADSGSPTPFGNVAVLRRPLDPGEWNAATKRMHDFFAAQPGGPFMLFAAWPTPNLRPMGFGLVGHPPLMLRPPGPVVVPAIPGFEIRKVADEDAAGAFERVMVDGYPVPELQPYTRGALFGDRGHAADGWHCYVGFLDDTPVATGAAFVDDQHVHVEFISALPQARGRGIGFAITAAATAVEPALPTMLIASDLGRPAYDRLGYLTLSRYTLWAGHRRA